MTARIGGALAIVCLLSAAGGAQQPEAPAPKLPQARRAALERAALELGRAGRLPEALEVVAAHRALDEPKAVAAAEKAAREAAAKAKAPATKLDDAVRLVRAAAAALAAGLAEAPDDAARTALARRVLALDEHEGAHAALGHERGPDGAFVAPEELATLRRRGELRAALGRARRAEVALETGASEHPILLAAYGRPGTRARHVGVTLHAPWSAPKTERTLRESLRAYSFSREVLRGDPGTDDAPSETFVLVESEPEYKKALARCREAGWVAPKEAERALKLSAFDAYADGAWFRVFVKNREAEAEASILSHLSYGLKELAPAQPALFVGHVHWVCLSYLGEPMPGVAWEEWLTKEGKGPSRTASRVEETVEREELFKLGEGGVVGARAYLAFLAARGEDPAWVNALLDEVGKIEGLDRLKTTFVVEWLHELGSFVDLAASSARPEGPGPTHSARMASALKEPFADFEERWRGWISPRRGPLAARLATPPPKPRPDADAAAARLAEVRKAAFGAARTYADAVRAVPFDESISDGCRKHARYLARHKDQAAAWPDAHEEWPDREGFSPEGATAAASGVIAPGVASAKDAVDGWMSTYYHRLPLLDPGLLRFGFGLEASVAVLDCGSFVAPVRVEGHVCWPYDGMKDVPLSFAPELPSPVPGEDESKFGYPFTVQWTEVDSFGRAAAPEPSLELREGDGKGPLVPAYVSTPSAPTNPALAPAGAACLMPKARLKPATSYSATATWPGGRTVRVKFTTGR